MSQPKKSSEVANCKFKWGKKRGLGGKQKECQFYQSFTFDDIDYSLYDSVYLHKEGEPEPYIGKLVKIWEQPEEKKKVKVLWFFRPVEILNYLEDGATLENEILLASGNGKGLTDINPLEAVAGKCHVVCTSKDSRNPQPSPDELRKADYIFYRTFNVGNFTISDKIDDKIADVDVSFLLNRDGQKEGNGNVMDDKASKKAKLDSSVKPPEKPSTSPSSAVNKDKSVLQKKDDKPPNANSLKGSPGLKSCSLKKVKKVIKVKKLLNGTVRSTTAVMQNAVK